MKRIDIFGVLLFGLSLVALQNHQGKENVTARMEFVELNDEGIYKLNGEEYSLEGLGNQLSPAAQKTNTYVMLSISGLAPMGEVKRLHEELKAAGVSGISHEKESMASGKGIEFYRLTR